MLWRDGRVHFTASTYTNFEQAKSNPKPVQPIGIPIHVGGAHQGGGRRAGRLGDGFFPGRSTVEELDRCWR